jgi:hypothetical protein
MLLAANPCRAISAATPRQIGQPFQGGARVAEMMQQGIEGARPDISASVRAADLLVASTRAP